MLVVVNPACVPGPDVAFTACAGAGAGAIILDGAGAALALGILAITTTTGRAEGTGAGLLATTGALQERYAGNLYTPQVGFWDTADQQQDAKWVRYLHHALTPALLDRPEFIRTLLRCVGLPPNAVSRSERALATRSDSHVNVASKSRTSVAFAPSL